ncbi:MAG TPA: hypothetical protein VNQ73_16485 [Ilumatobacter sp.]|nr:hypothetical protein [Ilumatobacter sp.]
MFAPLILRHNLFVGDVDVNDQLISMKISGSRAEIEIPETAGRRKTWAGGGDEYQVELEYLSDTDATEAMAMLFWDALADDEGTLEISGSFRDGPISEANPAFEAVALVNASAIGGTQNTVGRETVTFRLLDRPTKVTSAGS